MEDNPPFPYRGKPTAYLDHNILNVFRDYGFNHSQPQIANEYQIVYSDETLKEIAGSKGHQNAFLEVLTKLQAAYLRPYYEKPLTHSFSKATITLVDPFDAFNDYLQRSAEIKEAQATIIPQLEKFSGGRQGQQFSDVNAVQLQAFSNLLSSMQNNISLLPESTKSLIQDISASSISVLSKTLETNAALLRKIVQEEEEWNGIKMFQQDVGLGALQLNNIKPPGVLEKILKEFQKAKPERYGDKDVEDLFHLKHPIYPDGDYTTHQKVTVIYNLLNTYGYNPDGNLDIERRFNASMSDNGHAAMASFCDFLISNDEKLIRKAAAAYEYLNLSTQAQHVTIEKRIK